MKMFFEMPSYRVSVPITYDGNGIAEAIFAELENMGHYPSYFHLDEKIPENTDVIFLFGPFGKFLHIPEHFSGRPKSERPTFVYWNTEGLPDPRIPWQVVAPVSVARSWLGRQSQSRNPALQRLLDWGPMSFLKSRFLRFRYLGDYLYAYQNGWMDVFADISNVYVDLLRRRGLPAILAPFGSFQDWHEDLGLERDIDVLWMGKRASKRRSQALDQIRSELQARGVELYMVDNVERPFVFDEERTHLLNRTKITLNLLRTWYDENSLRICLAAPNRSLVVSEPLLPHVPAYEPGVHYVVAPIKELADTILYYLENEEERLRIVENAHRLMTTELTFGRSIQTIMNAVHRSRLAVPRSVSLKISV